MTAPPDVAQLLRDSLHRQVDDVPVTDPQHAVRGLERSMRHNHQRRLAMAVAVAAAAVVAVVGVGALAAGWDTSAEKLPAGPVLPAPGHRIAFSSAEQVLVGSDRGGAAMPVLAGGQPRFAPDGRHLAYLDGEGRVAVATVGTWQERPLEDRPLPADREVAGLVWSPDGSQLAFADQVVDSGKGADLHVVDVASGRSSVIRHFPAPYLMVMDWSPDGSTLVLGFDRSGEGGRLVVDTYDLATGQLTPLLRGWGETLGLRFSPDGSQIAFYSDSRQCICVAAPDGTGIRAVLTFSGSEPDSARLAWSPDGTQIVWDERFGGRVSLLDLATGRSRVLTDQGGRAPQIDWDRP